MKIAILTTDTVHHKYFISQICLTTDEVFCVLEKNILKSKFDTTIKFESKREIFEKKNWFKNQNFNFKQISNLKVLKVNKADNQRSINFLKKKNVKIIILFGVKKVSKIFLNKFKGKVFNLHGGDLRKYRGLDSHYWSIYHNDFTSLFVTLHTAEVKLDTGKIVSEKKINLTKLDKIYQLRYKNTNICVSLVKSFIKKLKLNKKIIFSIPNSYGRYYSFMPKQLKIIVEENFNKNRKKLND